MASTCSRCCARQRVRAHAATTASAGRPDDQLVEVLGHVAQAVAVPAPPGLHRRQPQRLAEQPLAQIRQVRHEGRVLHDAGADGVDHADGALPDALDQTGHPQPGPGSQLQRIGPDGVDPAEDDVDLLQLAQHPHPDPAVADGEVPPLDQREAEQGGEEGLVEGGLGQGARAEHDDPGVLHPGRRGVDQRGPHRLEERGQPVQVRCVVDLGHHPGDDPTVLHRVAGAGRRLGPVRHHLPLAVGVPAEVDRDHEQRRADDVGADHGAQVLVVIQHRRHRQVPTRQQLLGPVQVGDDRVQQLGALHDAGLQRRPLALLQHQRQRVQPPGHLLGQRQRLRRFAGRHGGRIGEGDRGGGTRGVGDAVVLEQPGDLPLRAPEVRTGVRLQALGQPGPGIADVALGSGELVVHRHTDREHVGLDQAIEVALEDRHPRPQRRGVRRRRSRVSG